MDNIYPRRLAIVTSHPIQYQAPLFRAIAAQPDVKLTVFFGCDYGTNPEKIHPGFGKAFAWDIPVLDGYDYRFLKNSRLNIGVNDWRLDGPELKTRLRSENYDAVIVFGWNKILFWQAIWWARTYQIPLVLRAESNLKNANSRLRQLIKRVLFPRLFAQFDAFLSIGNHNTALYRHYGVCPEKIYEAPYCVDNAFFANGAANSVADAKLLRSQLGIRESDTVFLFMAKFIERKRPLDLIYASLKIKHVKNFQVILVGGGELNEECERVIRENCIENVHLVGFVNQSILPKYYAAADVFVLPSYYETWGLVLNEAMASGLPGIVSDACGATHDMIIEGKTGFSYPMGDVDKLAQLMGRLASDPELREQMSAGAAEHVGNFSVTRVVTELNAILKDTEKRWI